MADIPPIPEPPDAVGVPDERAASLVPELWTSLELQTFMDEKRATYARGILEKRLKQEAAIRLAASISQDLSEQEQALGGVAGIGQMAAVKIGLDILSGAVKPKTLSEAVNAIKTLHELNPTNTVGEGAQVVTSSTERTVIFQQVEQRLAEIRQKQEPIEVEASEE